MISIIKNLMTLISFFFFTIANAQETIPLYDGSIPNSKPFVNLEKSDTDKAGNIIVRDISLPTLQIFLPPKSKANGSAVIICPGGGYWVNAIKHEGTDVAEEFVKKGVAAFVLKYRLPDERWMQNISIGPLQDAERAILLVRSKAKQWHIDSSKVGIMGFSAGGHLASTLGTHYEEVLIDNLHKVSLRPNFMILIYPVITTDTVIVSSGIVDRLLGKNPTPDLIKAYSNEIRVSASTPVTFIVQATNDDLPVKNSLLFYEALVRNKVKAEMHLYQGGGHGFGMNNKSTKDKWMDRCFSWMEANGWLENSLR
ncbi:MAG: alpha/beta hydrolase [Bacteroidetes bacterium]|nr:MAG: alpha/beta hydrolase [Bacteroidota bacterium]